MVSHDWLCVSRRHMLSPPSSVCRGIGASGAVHQASTTTSRRAPAKPAIRPVQPVQVRSEVKGQESVVMNCYETSWLVLKCDQKT